MEKAKEYYMKQALKEAEKAYEKLEETFILWV